MDPALLAYEGFDTATTSNTPFGLMSGYGWTTTGAQAGWGFHDEGNAHLVESDSPLIFQNLLTAGNYMHNHGEEGGRAFDVAGKFAAYRIDSNGNAAIGKPGTTLWMSILVRPDDGNNKVQIGVAATAFPFAAQDCLWSMGYYRDRGLTAWGIISGTQPVIASNTQGAAGKVTLLVASFEFQAAQTITTLYVNPTPGTTAPTHADAMLNVAPPLAFWDFQEFGDPFSFDEIRVGTTFDAVAPTK